MLLKNNIYNLHYNLEDIEPNLQKVIAFLTTRIDQSDPTALLSVREDGRILLSVASKCCLSADFYYRKVGVKSGTEYALMASLRDYTKEVKSDLETTMFSLANTINYYKNER
jgi:hypothetical protein